MIARHPASIAPRSSIAVVAARYPLVSETFVWREVARMRARGHQVHVIGLHASDDRVVDEHGRSEQADAVVYENSSATLFGRAAKELWSRPMRTLRTLGRAVGNAWNARDVRGLRPRMKVLVQALAAVAIAEQLRQAKVTHVHCHFAHAPATVGMYAAMQLEVPFSFTGHANDLFQRRALLREKLRRAQFVGCISQWHKQLYQSIEPTVEHRCRMVRCGIDLEQWQRDGSQKAVQDPIRVLSVGRLVAKKGFDTLLRALARLNAREPGRWQLTIVGDGPDRDSLRELTHELGMQQCVNWQGSMANGDLPAMFGEHDLFALCCRADEQDDRDGIPVVLMEAMAAGLPVVAGDLPAIRELVINRRTGLLVDGRQSDQAAAALWKLAEDDLLRRTLARQARQRVSDEFSGHRNVDRLLDAIAGRPSAPTAPTPPTPVSQAADFAMPDDIASSRPAASSAQHHEHRAIDTP